MVLCLGAALVGCGGGGGASDGSGNTGSGSSGAGGGQNVVDPARAATLSWNAPATRVNGDGIAMGELQGYIIHYGQSEGDLSQSVEINDANVMDYTIQNLSEGDWYFSVQVVDVDGLVSAPSSVVSKTI